MKRKQKTPTFDEVAGAFIHDITDPELLTLRLHAALEAFMYHLLAASLDIPVADVPQLSIYQLTELSLRGDRTRELRQAINRFTSLRNQVAHCLQPVGYTVEMREFAALILEGSGKDLADVASYREALRSLVFTIGLQAKFAIEGPEAEAELQRNRRRRLRNLRTMTLIVRGLRIQ